MSDPSPQRTTRPSPCGCLVAVAVILVLVPAVGLWVYLARAADRVERALAEVVAAGEPITPNDLEDFYAHPTPAQDPTSLWLTGIELLRTSEYRLSAGNLPIVGTGEGKVPLPGQSWPEQMLAEQHLAKQAAALDKLHAAAQIGGPARYPTDFRQGLGMLLPHVEGLRQAARLLELEARVKARTGNAQGAANSIHALFMAAQSLEREPILISQLVRTACHGMGVRALEDLLPQVAFSEQDLARLQADLEAADLQGGLQHAMPGERVIGLHTFEDPQSVAPNMSRMAASATAVTRRDG